MTKELRNKLKISQSELARILNCTVTSISNWENGKSKPSPIYKKLITELLNKDS